MRDPWSPVNTSPQPPLFELAASAVTLQVLVDRGEQTVVLGVQTIDPIDGNLVALWATSPVKFDDMDEAMRAADREFKNQVWAATGPFA